MNAATQPKTVIYYAPQGWGKTRNKHDLMRQLGCTSVVDDWFTKRSITRGALHLTNQRPSVHWSPPAGVSVVIVDSQQKQSGFIRPGLSNGLAAIAIAAGLCLGTALDSGPSDTQAAQDVADDATASTQLARDTAACHQHYGPHAQILMLDGVHLVCRPPLSGPATTTAQVQR